MELKRQQTSGALMESIIDRVLREPDSITLFEVAADITKVVGADYCTIYGKQLIDGESYLVVAASTSESIFHHAHSEMYYRLGKQADGFYDGYTGYSATERECFHTSNLSDMS